MTRVTHGTDWTHRKYLYFDTTLRNKMFTYFEYYFYVTYIELYINDYLICLKKSRSIRMYSLATHTHINATAH